MTKKIYYDVFQDNDDTFGLTHPPKGIKVYLANTGPIETWKRCEMSVEGGLTADYLNNTLICRICSEPMKELLTREEGDKITCNGCR